LTWNLTFWVLWCCWYASQCFFPAVAHLNLAQLLERRGRYEEAVAVYRRCSRLNGAGLKDPRTHEATRISALLHLGRLYADQGRLHKAVAMYQEAVEMMPENYPPQVNCANNKRLSL
jgi:tetratricopeptide (TPR) repeat protein